MAQTGLVHLATCSQLHVGQDRRLQIWANIIPGTIKPPWAIVILHIIVCYDGTNLTILTKTKKAMFNHHHHHWPNPLAHHFDYQDLDGPFRAYNYGHGYIDRHGYHDRHGHKSRHSRNLYHDHNHHHGHRLHHGHNHQHDHHSQSLPTKALGRHLWKRWLLGSPGHASSSADLELLHDPKSQPARGCLKLEPREAISLLVSSSLTSDDHHQGHQKDEVDIESLPFKVFNDVDASLFHGVLRGNVHLRWSKDLPDYLQGRTTLPCVNSCPRIMIELSRNLSTHKTFEDVLIALVHQMVHAYLIQSGKKQDTDLGHMNRFNIAMGFIQRKVLGSRTSSEPWKLGCKHESSNGFDHNGQRHHPAKGSTFCCVRDKGTNYKSIEKTSKEVELAPSVPKFDLRTGVAFDKDNVPR